LKNLQSSYSNLSGSRGHAWRASPWNPSDPSSACCSSSPAIMNGQDV
jgi:hypothetical protein